MRNLIALAFLALFISCATIATRQLERNVEIDGLDFRPYIEKGFLFTPIEEPRGEYDGVGLVTIRVIPEVKLSDITKPFDQRKWQREWVGNVPWQIERLNTDEGLQEVYKVAVELGADALYDFKIIRSSVRNGGLTVPIHVVSGFAVKRK